jgi:hypothetical protein
MSQDGDRLAMLALIDEAQSTLTRLVRSADPQRLAKRPAVDNWSVIENVRHLLFAEQAHLGRFLPGGVTWSALGLPPHNMAGQKRLSAVGSEPTANIEDVLSAWATVHDAVRAGCTEGSSDVDKAIQKNLKHLNAHLKTIERLLRE